MCTTPQVTNVAIWGNHSATQYPDFANARISGKPVPEVITDRAWLEGEFIETIQKRGAAVIAKRGQSSATSAAHAIVDSVNSIHTPTPGDDWHSLAVVSAGEYGVPEGLVFGYPGAERRTRRPRSSKASSTTTSRKRRSPPPLRSSSKSATRSASCSGADARAVRGSRSSSPTASTARYGWCVFDDHASYWVALDLGEAGFVAIRHDHVSRPRAGALLEVRADGLWAELVCEVPDEHWTFGLEAFGLRLDDRDEALTADVGERVPVGFDLEWDEGQVLGEILLGRSRIPFDGTGTFEHVADDSSVTDGLGGLARGGSPTRLSSGCRRRGITPSTKYALTTSSMQVLRAVPYAVCSVLSNVRRTEPAMCATIAPRPRTAWPDRPWCRPRGSAERRSR